VLKYCLLGTASARSSERITRVSRKSSREVPPIVRIAAAGHRDFVAVVQQWNAPGGHDKGLGNLEAGNVSALVSLLTEDVVITAPLAGGKYVGTAVATRLFETVIFPEDRTYRLIPTRANGQPAFGVYVLDPATGAFHVNGMLVLTLAGNRISAMTRFDNSLIARFGLPRRIH